MSIIFEKVDHVYAPHTPFAYHALKEIDLEIKEGSFTAIIGHTGSGKSTLIQHLNALLLPTQGTLYIDDFKISATEKTQALKPLRKKVGLVFQFPEYQLFEETIEKDILFGPINFGVSEEEAKQSVKEVIRLVGLDESYLQKSPFDLSGGQKRRVAIAGILVMNPDILVLDEPTAGLDPQGAKEMMTLFKKIHQQGKTIILVTHDMNHVLNYCDDAVIMNEGKIVRHKPVQEIFEDQEYLTSLSIDMPLMTKMIIELNQHGYHINPAIKDIHELCQAIGGELRE